VAQYFIGDKKDDVSVADIFRLQLERTPTVRQSPAIAKDSLCNFVRKTLDRGWKLNGGGLFRPMQLDFCAVRVQNPVSGFRSVQAHNFAIPLLGQAKTSKLKAPSFLEPDTATWRIRSFWTSSLYPSSIIATNMSHATMSPEESD
jgi:hypothetical protein